MNKEKRERQANFTLSEEKLLVELVLKYGSVIENKETDSDIWKKKAETWELIDSAMVVSSGIQRGSKALKNKWEKIKKNVKQRLSEEKKEIYKTGGGVAKTFKKIDYYNDVVELLGVSATGLASVFDSDIVDSSQNNLRQTSTTTVGNNEVDDLLLVLEETSSPNMFDDSELFNQTSLNMFDRLRIEKPDFMTKIKIIDGDLEQPSLGLSPKDRDWLIENVNFVFHCAATIKFNETLQIATRINIQGTDNILTLATMMKNLKGFVHVSTAYSHCPRNVIKEEFYPTPITVKELKNMSKDEISCPNILKNWPNTYTFTKAITENLVSSNDNQLPISIFRPSIIGCTKLEPNPGWLDNINGPSGIVTGVIAGFLRTIKLDKNKIADIIPVDYTVNALISVMWDTVNRHRHSNQMNKVPKIYNYVSSVESPLTWGKYIEEMHNNYYDIPPLRAMWYIFYISHTNSLVSTILRFCLHTIPAAFMDLLLIISGQSPKMLKMYSKTENALDLLREFTTRQWSFENKNTVELWLSLSEEDHNTFWFSFEDFDWKSYIKIYYLGIRKHILHEDLSNTERAVTKNRKLLWLHRLCIVFIIYLLLQLLYWMFIIL